MTPPSNPLDTRPRLIVLGDVMSDIVVRTATPIASGSDTLAGISVHGGGSGANQATWLATTAPHLAVHFVGCVGDDLLGRAHHDAFRRAGVIPHLAVDPHRPTGTVVSLVDAHGERSMLTDRGANAGLTVASLPRELFHAATWLHISGYTLLSDDSRPVALEAIRLARTLGIRFSVDPASEALLLAAGPHSFLTWTEGADLCFPNLDEGRLLSGATDPTLVATSLSAHYATVALKLGASGALIAREGAIAAHSPCAPASVVDSTGAGDAFCAGLLPAWIAGDAPEVALAAATSLAAVAIARAGARPFAGDLRMTP